MPIDSTKALTAIFDEIKDLALKMFVGVITFVPIDGALGLIFKYLSLILNIKDSNKDNNSPFFLLRKSYEVISWIYHNTNIYLTFLILSLFLYALGKVIYILRQPLILDKIKGNYATFIRNYAPFSKDENDTKLFENLRESVIRKLKTDKKFSNIIKEIGEEYIENNDYFLYLLLGKDYYSPDIQKRNQEANEISFLGSSVIVLTSLTSLFYFITIVFHFKIPKLSNNHYINIIMSGLIIAILYLLSLVLDPITKISEISKFSSLKKYLAEKILINLILTGLIILIFLILMEKSKIISSKLPPFLLNIANIEQFTTLAVVIVLYIILFARVISIQIAANRYISRNMRLYLNYLTNNSNDKN